MAKKKTNKKPIVKQVAKIKGDDISAATSIAVMAEEINSSIVTEIGDMKSDAATADELIKVMSDSLDESLSLVKELQHPENDIVVGETIAELAEELSNSWEEYTLTQMLESAVNKAGEIMTQDKSKTLRLRPIVKELNRMIVKIA